MAIENKSVLWQLTGNLLSGWGAIAIRSGIAFALVPFLLLQLGKEGFGLIALLTVIVSWSTVADLGLRGALGRELSEKVARKDEQGFRVLSSTALVLYLVIGLTVSLLGWILAPWMIDVFKVGDALRSDAILLVRVFGCLSMLVAFTLPILTAGLTSFMRFDVVNMIQAATAIGIGLCLFILLPVFDVPPHFLWAAIVLGGACFTLVVTYIFYRGVCYEGKLGLRYVKGSELKPLFNLSGYMYALQLTNNLTERANPLIVSSFMGPAGVALYTAGAKVSQMLRPAVMTFVNQLHPLTTQCHVLQRNDRQRRLFLDGSRYTFMLGSLVAVGVFFFAMPFCRLWLWNSLGEDYRTVAEVMRLIAIVDLTAYARGTQWPILLGMKRLKLLVWAQFPSAVLNILGSIYLIGFTDLGLGGVVYATILINAIRLPLLTWHVARCVGVSVWDCLLKSYLRPLICLSAMVISSWLVVNFMGLTTWSSLIAGVAIAMSCWVISVMLVGVTSKEREMFLGLVVKAAGKVVTSRRS